MAREGLCEAVKRDFGFVGPRQDSLHIWGRPSGWPARCKMSVAETADGDSAREVNSRMSRRVRKRRG